MAAPLEGEFQLPIFPLPNLVFFPSTRLPLHIFEPRYRQMVTDVLESDSRFAIVLLKPGWEADYFGAPPVYPIATVGTIEQSVPLEDGRFNLLVRGDARIRIVDEVSRVPYRTARVVAAPERVASAEQAWAEREWLADLARQYIHALPEQLTVPEIDSASLESLTNALIMTMYGDAEDKQRLLEVDDLIGRAQKVGEELVRRLDGVRFLSKYRRTPDPSRN